MRRARLRPHLWQIKGRHVETMSRQLDGAQFAILVVADKLELAATEIGFKGGVEAVVTEEIFRSFALTVDSSYLRIGYKLDRLHLADQRTGKFANQQGSRIRRRFLVVGIQNAENIACILYQSMLETASGAKEGNVGFPGKTDGIECAFHAEIGAAG